MSSSSASRPRPRGARPFWKRVVALLLGAFVSLIVLEIGLRFLPVNDVTGLSTVNAANPVLRLGPNRCTTRSKGARLSLVTEVCTNNVGFRNDQAYELDRSTPLMALVGDSYVVAATVSFEDTMGARLSDEAEGIGRVFSFGVRGAAFSQYLIWANYAREHFQPDGFVFLVIANDFGGALRPAPGYHHFERNADGSSRLVRVDSRMVWRQRLVKNSSLARYLILNCQITSRGFFRRSVVPAPRETVMRRFVGHIKARQSEEVIEKHRWVFQASLDRLPEATGVSNDRILLVMDGMRPHMYDDMDLAFAETSAWADLRRFVIESAGEREIEVVDLHTHFVEAFERDGARFESKEDGHWNATGHGVAASATARSAMFESVFTER